MLLHYSLVPAAHIPSSKFRRFAILSGDKGYLMSVQASTLDLQPSLVTTNAWRSRTGRDKSARTTKLYDRRNDQVTLDQVERIVL